MEINTIPQNQFIDLFGTGKVPEPKGSGFPNDGIQTADIFSTTDTTTLPASTTDTTTIASTTDTTTVAASTTDTTTQAVDIFADDKKPGRKPKYDFSDMSGYFEDRLKSGKFVKIEEDAEDGTKKLFIPKTPEEFDEVFEIQVNHRLAKEKENVVQRVYQSKTPAWQAVLKFSELVDDPSEVIPFIEGVKTMESVASVDENTPEGAERIVRTRLQQKGDTPELIDQQVETLKAADKLISTSKVYKPMILQQEQALLTQMIQEKKEQDAEYEEMVQTIEKNAVKAIETPLFGKQKLSREEKALVYEMIAYPAEDTKGYRLFTEIDNLFQKGDFETLKLLALIAGGKKDAVLGYVSASAATTTAAGLQRQLRVAGSTGSSTNIDVPNDTPVVQRRQYTANFGR